MKGIQIINLPSVKNKMLKGRYNRLKPKKIEKEIERFKRREVIMDAMIAFDAKQESANTLYPRDKNCINN